MQFVGGVPPKGDLFFIKYISIIIRNSMLASSKFCGPCYNVLFFSGGTFPYQKPTLLAHGYARQI